MADIVSALPRRSIHFRSAIRGKTPLNPIFCSVLLGIVAYTAFMCLAPQGSCSAISWTHRGAIADELGHFFAAECRPNHKDDLVEFLTIDVENGTSLTQAGARFPDDDIAAMIVAWLLDGRVLADIAPSETYINLSRIGKGGGVFFDYAELSSRIFSRAVSAAAGPIARAEVDNQVPDHPLTRAAQGESRISADSISLTDWDRVLTLLFFRAAPAGLFAPAPAESRWDFISRIRGLLETNEELLKEVCSLADEIQVRAMEVLNIEALHRQTALDQVTAATAKQGYKFIWSDILSMSGRQGNCNRS